MTPAQNAGSALRQGSVLVCWALTLIRAIQSSGISLETLVREIDLDTTVLRNGGERLDQEYVDQLWRYAATHIPDPSFGLTVAKHVRPSSFHVVGDAMAHSSSLYRALHRFSQFCRLISQSATATLVRSAQTIALEFYFDPGKNPPTYRSYDVVLAMVLNLVREISGKHIVPEEVRFADPIQTLPPCYQEFFNCRISFGAIHSAIVFSKEDLEEAILGANERLANLLDEVANAELAIRMEGRFATRVKDALMLQFAEGSATRERTAQMLHMTPRTLLRRLKEEGATYNSVVNQLREELALKYIKQHSIPLREVASRLGFADYTAFARAFCRWTGARPRALRSLAAVNIPSTEKPAA